MEWVLLKYILLLYTIFYRKNAAPECSKTNVRPNEQNIWSWIKIYSDSIAIERSNNSSQENYYVLSLWFSISSIKQDIKKILLKILEMNAP